MNSTQRLVYWGSLHWLYNFLESWCILFVNVDMTSVNLIPYIRHEEIFVWCLYKGPVRWIYLFAVNVNNVSVYNVDLDLHITERFAGFLLAIFESCNILVLFNVHLVISWEQIENQLFRKEIAMENDAHCQNSLFPTRNVLYIKLNIVFEYPKCLPNSSL